ncbi:MAG: hypothetical protein QME50_03720 [Candidatus Bathyarchaeota archaeon]|nr:hypothetical protein [Candidatus Bathyarchaeota archaeon]
MFGEKVRTVFLGLAFLIFLLLSYVENTIFFQSLNIILDNQLVAIAVLFIHNLLVISLIFLGMTFYVNLVVLNFFKREKYGNIVLEHPKTFALVFTVMIVFLSILRGGTLVYG